MNTDSLQRRLNSVARVAALFALLLAVLLGTTLWQLHRADPLNATVVESWRRQLAENPGDTTAVEQIRALDWLARKAFFTSQRQLVAGSMLLAGLVAAALISMGLASHLVPPQPAPTGKAAGDWRWQAGRRAWRWLAAAAGVGLGVVFLLAIWLPTPAWLSTLPQPPASERPAAAAELLPEGAGWPGFRGWGGLAVSNARNLPTAWDVEAGEGLVWRVPVELPGFGSAVVWQDRVFLTGADATRRLLYAYSMATGELLWQLPVHEIPEQPVESPEVSGDTGYAAPTPAVGPQGVCAIFANGDLVSVSLTGELQWFLNLGRPENHYGHASSLLIQAGVLFVQYDHGQEQLLMAFEVESGKLIWEVERTTISWASPVYVKASPTDMLLVADSLAVTAYDPRDGSLLWSEECLGGEVAPSPAYADGMVVVANEYAQACGVRADPNGNSEVVWTWYDGLPDVASPVAFGGLVFLATSGGEVICLRLADGHELWRHEYRHGFYASPVVAEGRLYLTDMAGETHILAAEAALRPLGRGVLGQPCYSTPALVDGAIVIRGDQHLIRLGQPDLPTAAE